MAGVQLKRHQMRLAVVALCFLLVTSPMFSNLLHTAWQGIVAVSARRHYVQWPALETEYFQLRYSPEDEDIAAWLGSEADAAVKQVAAILPHQSGTKRPWLVVVPDQETFQEVFGWSDGTGALGVYLADTVKILTPRAWDWVGEEERLEQFVQKGPLVHEYTHFVLDLRTRGNYTRWFSEGLSQIVEYQVLGYEWLEAGSSLANTLYSLDELDKGFDELPNQALAYRQGLSMVTYMEHLKGVDGLNRFIDVLGEQTPFYQALKQVYGLDREEFINGWQKWHREDDRWFRVREDGKN
ncbi:peptidase MA family metallohydrolase [Dethiobacter alkaliphilus]|uniref:Peptidase MA-like domain-containing protein n=1 Tax=Dethiobacter alkaliphilus AHT 1 TaxID=555088 RepID=C0GIA1_DETAL|nr:hypothetical protein [Dethiobacter alkaliphilus]EEG76949.1 hypothetical protein DealDRAFT_2210 [Dethiobacter alkaliphilus AHT 1]